jgi:hypothetical protein
MGFAGADAPAAQLNAEAAGLPVQVRWHLSLTHKYATAQLAMLAALFTGHAETCFASVVTCLCCLGALPGKRALVKWHNTAAAAAVLCAANVFAVLSGTHADSQGGEDGARRS